MGGHARPRWPNTASVPVRTRTHDRSGNNGVMGDGQRIVVLVDDLRSFVDGRAADVARTSAEAVKVLERYRSQRLDELWLGRMRRPLGGHATLS
jgi:hypothetical protein